MAHLAPPVARDAVLKESIPLPQDMLQIKGYDFNQGVDHQALLQSFLTTGFQASSFGQAVQEINRMVSLPSQTLYPTTTLRSNMLIWRFYLLSSENRYCCLIFLWKL